jgi:hypothetical protein
MDVIIIFFFQVRINSDSIASTIIAYIRGNSTLEYCEISPLMVAQIKLSGFGYTTFEFKSELLICAVDWTGLWLLIVQVVIHCRTCVLSLLLLKPSFRAHFNKALLEHNFVLCVLIVSNQIMDFLTLR